MVDLIPLGSCRNKIRVFRAVFGFKFLPHFINAKSVAAVWILHCFVYFSAVH